MDERQTSPPVGGRSPSGRNGTPRVLGYRERSEPWTKDGQAKGEGQTHPHRWQMTVSHKRLQLVISHQQHNTTLNKAIGKHNLLVIYLP